MQRGDEHRPNVLMPQASNLPPAPQPQARGQGKGGKRITLPPGASRKANDDHAPQTERILPTGQRVRLPLDAHTHLQVLWRPNDWRRARIVERRKNVESADPFEYEYYVHYKGMNRRMDEWKTQAELDLRTVEVESVEDARARMGGAGVKRKTDHDSSDDEGHGDFDPQQLKEHEEFTKVKNIDKIELGRYEMDTWYFSPFPPEFRDTKKVYFCEFTLEFFKKRHHLVRHLRKIEINHPPGDEIYRHENLSMFEVDGRKERQYCQNLSWLAKLFLDHKTLYSDVDLFLFYVLCECDERGAHIVGYFSKASVREKTNEEGYNLACILIFPPYQRKGYGKFLIQFSYELSKLEGKAGTPERPLSDLGLVSYRSYWTRTILLLIKEQNYREISIKEISDITKIRQDDIVDVLLYFNLVQYVRGQHVLCMEPAVVEKIMEKCGKAGPYIDSRKIIWTPPN